jgi:hypothetical protein
MRSTRLIPILVAAIALLYGGWILHYGILWGEDIDRLSRWADGLVAHHFHFVSFLHDTRFVAPPILYLGFITVVAVAKVVAGSDWPLLIVVLNWAAVILNASLVLTTVRRVTSSVFAVVVAAVLLVNFEMLQFTCYPMTDVLFLGIATTVLVMSLRVAEQPSARAILGGTAALLVACMFRPAAAPLVVVWVVALLWPRIGLRTIAALIVLSILLFAALMHDITLWPFTLLRRWVDYIHGSYARGTIVTGRPETSVAPPVGYMDYLAMILRRWLSFFAPTMSSYSTLHKLANLLYFIPLYCLALAAAFLRRSAATTLLLIAILATSAFHGMQEVDYDHRYRLPVLPPLIMLASIGTVEVARRCGRPVDDKN